MKIYPLLSRSGLFTRLMILFALVLISVLVTTGLSVIVTLITGIEPSKVYDNIGMIRFLMLIQSFFVFLLPAVVMGKLIQNGPWDYLLMKQKPKLRTALLTVVSILVSIPFMEQIILWNEGIRFPEFLAPIETWMRQQEDQARIIVEKGISLSSFAGWCWSILLVCVMAALSEEMFFRGLLQRMFLDKWHKKLLAVLLSGFIFSAIHLQFYGFVPRMLMGAYFGILFIWSGNLWIPVLAHFTNNFIALLTMYFSKDATQGDALLPAGEPMTYVATAISILLFCIIVIRIKKSET